MFSDTPAWKPETQDQGPGHVSPPLISVVIPSYNRAALIEKSIASIEQQSFRDFEIIVVDDGSSDDTEQVVTGLKNPHLTYIRHPQNRGANAARNTGIQAARGEFIAFQDSDDTWHPDKLEKQQQALAAHSADICFCAFTRLHNGTESQVPKPGYHIQPGCHKLHTTLLRGNFISCQTLLVKRQLLLSVGLFDEDLPRLQDWEICLRLARSHPIVYVDESLVRVEIGDDSISRQIDNYARAADLILRKHRKDFADDPVAASMFCINVALDALRHRKFRVFIRFLGRSIHQGGLGIFPALINLYRRR